MAALPATSLDLAQPISWPPSQYWSVRGIYPWYVSELMLKLSERENGDWWSSFALRVGNPAQVVRVLISTAGQATWVVSDQGCLPNDFKACEKDRGGLFNSSLSQTWNKLGFYSLGLETNLGPSDDAIIGLETVGLDFSNAAGAPLLSDQILATLSGNQYPLGVFGLGRQPTHLNNFTNSHPSFLTTLHGQHYIPSLSWSYTAGARYRKSLS